MGSSEVYKLGVWLDPIAIKYEDWLLGQGRVVEACRIRKWVEEMDQHYFHDWNMSPFEAKVAAKYNYVHAFIKILQGQGYPNLLGRPHPSDIW